MVAAVMGAVVQGSCDLGPDGRQEPVDGLKVGQHEAGSVSSESGTECRNKVRTVRASSRRDMWTGCPSTPDGERETSDDSESDDLSPLATRHSALSLTQD